jgi:tRNA(Ile2) C34 agmatinyltransferase TiaS
MAKAKVFELVELTDAEPVILEATPTPCPACDGPGCYLGTLGRLDHFRCQDCGLDFCDDVPALEVA